MPRRKRKKNLVTEYIRAEQLSKITSALVIAFCEHKFRKMGMGYECEKCRFYTGTNTELNNHIAIEL